MGLRTLLSFSVLLDKNEPAGFSTRSVLEHYFFHDALLIYISATSSMSEDVQLFMQCVI